MQGQWSVRYLDGTQLAQYDASSPLVVNGEVPYSAIYWPIVETLRFESEFATAELQVPLPEPGYNWSLRSRVFADAGGGGSVQVFLLLQGRAEVPSSSLTDDDVRYVLYWLPDGSVHESPLFWSPEVAKYAAWLTNPLDDTVPDGLKPPPDLPRSRGEISLFADAHIV